jgi:hypothetical protein
LRFFHIISCKDSRLLAEMVDLAGMCNFINEDQHLLFDVAEKAKERMKAG